jgi:transcriptional regulator with XRE-family HTH domain
VNTQPKRISAFSVDMTAVILGIMGENNISQTRLADDLGVAKSTVSRQLRGGTYAPDTDLLGAVAGLAGIPGPVFMQMLAERMASKQRNDAEREAKRRRDAAVRSRLRPAK